MPLSQQEPNILIKPAKHEDSLYLLRILLQGLRCNLNSNGYFGQMKIYKKLNQTEKETISTSFCNLYKSIIGVLTSVPPKLF